ncbi:uncharacterized protein LOC113004779 [Solenopsis invicta]|uniref:uncharacterized protein LOC113004779 n=1 Tax=Solenopsis invicta TaxID=13686 RepID=UPI00193CA720|nr:uncharacterized protein LOC113004779 [Solenopsis invicta]
MSSSKRISSERRRLVEELHASARRHFPRRRVIIKGFDDLWQADIVEMRPYSNINRGHHYILTMIDALSKFAWAVGMKSKSGKETADVIAEIIRKSGRCPRNLQTDMGKEFYNADVQKLLRKHHINHYSTTLKDKMWKMFTLQGSYKWVDELPRLVSEYNDTLHRTIGMRPVDVTPVSAKKLLNTVYSHVKIAAPAKFKVGAKSNNADTTTPVLHDFWRGTGQPPPTTRNKHCLVIAH